MGRAMSHRPGVVARRLLRAAICSIVRGAAPIVQGAASRA